jgi:hypothetical protein
MEVTKLIRGARIADVVVLVDGLTRSGKGMLGPILSSFERVEIERVEPILEYIGGLHRLGKIERDAAVALLRMETDQHLFDGMIGRNVNFRWEDHSSVWHNPRPWRYVRRLFMPEREEAMKRIAEERPIYQNMTHRQLANFRLYREAFGPRLRMVEMVRHPVELMDSWMRKRKGERIGTDALINALCVEYEGQSLPYYALGWEKAFLAASPLGRVIRMIDFKTRQWVETWRGLTSEERSSLLMVPFEAFVTRPESWVERLAAFIGTAPSGRTPSELSKQRCPRDWNPDEVATKRRKLEDGASPEERRILDDLVVLHEQVRRELGS